MKHRSFLHKFTTAVLSCTLCCTGMTVPAFSADETEELPAKFDLRDEGAVTSVKQQYGGTCGIYSGMAAIESNMIKKGMADNTLDLSESHFSWFTFCKGSPDDPDDPLYGDGLELGTSGYTHLASSIYFAGSLACWKGVVPESETSENKAKLPFDESQRYASIAHLQDSSEYPLSDSDTIKKKLMEKGAMQITYLNVHQAELYSEQHAYYETLYDGSNVKELDAAWHAVCLCGWDDSFPKENFTVTPPGDGAWLCKNSWGDTTVSMEEGFFYLSYYEPSITNIVQFDVEPVDNYDGIYQCCGFPHGVQTLKNRGYAYANVYTAKKDENITAAAIYTGNPDLPYEISIYALKENYQNPLDGELLAKISGTEPYEGYHTYQLHTVCQVVAGQQFSVAVKTGIKEEAHLWFDMNGSGPVKTYYMNYGETSQTRWSLVSSSKNCGNLVAKAFTKDGTAVSEQNYPDALYRQAVSKAYDTNEDYVITEKEFADAESFIRGDLNRDGKVNAVDLALLKQVLLGSHRTDLCLIAGDWNADQALNTADAEGILRFLLGETQ